MEPLEFEVRSGWESWESRDTTGEPRPAGHGSPGPGHPAWDEPAPGGYRVRRGTVAPQRSDSLSMVARLLSVADYEAAAITQQASYQAAMITRQVACEAEQIREAARREADKIRQQAAAQADAVRDAAEMEAAEVRTAVMSMQTELGEFAARITDTFPDLAFAPIRPARRPAVRPATPPAVHPAANPPSRPKARPHAAPADRPARGPGARPAKGPASGRGRQVAAMRIAVIATSALFLVAVVAGVMEVHLHGFDFFIFRATGTGETGPNGLQENQGPGQPGAPKPSDTKARASHIKVQPSPHSTVTVHTGH
ncbi:MAG TPA: hypothetical protein VHY58_16505 [Streptosporangiaceae bacterium]|nr:hypothetical protein [Streptosporangiaceae bacterium]